MHNRLEPNYTKVATVIKNSKIVYKLNCGIIAVVLGIANRLLFGELHKNIIGKN